MADRQRTVAVKVRLEQDGNLEVFREMAKDADFFEESAGRAEKAADKAMAQIERGGTVSIKTLANLRLAVDDYREALESAEAAGQEIGDEQVAQLQELEGAYEKAAARAGEFGKAQQDARRSLDDATEAAGGAAPRITGLNDLIGEVTKSLGSGAVKWAGYAAAVAAAAQAGWEAGNKLRDGLNWLTEGEFDEGIQRLITEIGNLDEGLLTSAERAKQYENQLNILRKNGIDPTGMSAAEVAAEVDKLGLAMQRGGMEAAAAAEKYAKWKEGLGLDKEALDAAAAELADFIRRFAEENEQLSQEEISSLFAPDVEALRKKYGQLKEEVQPELQAIVEEWEMVGTAAESAGAATQSSADQQKAALEQVVAALETYRQSWGTIHADLAAAAQAAGLFIAPWEQASDLRATMDSIADGATHLKSVMQDLGNQGDQLAGLKAALSEVNRLLDGSAQFASAAAAQISRVLTPDSKNNPYGSAITRDENRGYGDF